MRCGALHCVALRCRAVPDAQRTTAGVNELLFYIVLNMHDVCPSNESVKVKHLTILLKREEQRKWKYREKLEYLAVYGRASMAAFRQLSTHIVPTRSNLREARLNTHGQKFDPESLYEPIKFETLQPYLVNKY